MSLSTVQCANDKSARTYNKIDFINRTMDIHGAQSKKWVDTRKPARDLSLNIHDIQTCYPTRTLHISRHINQVSDIPGTTPKSDSHVFARSKRQTDPLQPEYNLKVSTDYVDLSRKFIRDNLDISDIDTRKRYSNKYIASNILNTRDIPGASPKGVKHIDRSYKDYKVAEKKVYQKDYDPLNPVYKVRDDQNNLIEVGHVQGSGTKQIIREVKGHNSLDNSDIEGSHSGTLLKTRFIPNPNKQRNAIDISDISGAGPDTRGKLHKMPNGYIPKQDSNLRKMSGNYANCQLDYSNFY